MVFHLFRPILLAISTPKYKLLPLHIKFLAPLLIPLTLNEYKIEEGLWNYDSNLTITSFDIESLFTNIPLLETIDLSVKLLFNDKLIINGFTISGFHDLLTVTMFESLVLFDGE